MKNRLLQAVLFLFISASVQVPAVTVNDDEKKLPAWMLFEKGRLSFELKNFGEAAAYFRAAKDKQSAYPEAEYWLAKIHEIDNNYVLAEQGYIKAWDLSRHLVTKTEKYDILYSLAELNRKKNQMDYYEKVLEFIVQDDRDFFTRKGTPPASKIYRNFYDKISDPAYYTEKPFPANLFKLYSERGLSKLLEHYRLADDFSTKAHSILGEIYYKHNRHSVKTGSHLMFSAVKTFTSMINYQRRADPDFTFRNINQFKEIFYYNENLKNFAVTNNLARDLYYLGAVFQKEGSIKLAKEAWDFSAYLGDDTFSRLSGRALSDPSLIK
jgi:tetratricopeptide (TPR) repeat protein